MEIRSETDYVTHHIQKVVGFFSAMRMFYNWLKDNGHKVIYLKINDNNNLQCFASNLEYIIRKENCNHFEYQLPDEYRVDLIMKNFCENNTISSAVFDTEHFFTSRTELGDFFDGKFLSRDEEKA
jgi:deoxyribodipyrimidine photolyase-related protein